MKEKMKVEYIPVSELKLYEKNAKIHTDEQIERMEAFAASCAQDEVAKGLDITAAIEQERENVCLIVADAFGCGDATEVIRHLCGECPAKETLRNLEKQIQVEW